jgi:hypothetical protein
LSAYAGEPHCFDFGLRRGAVHLHAFLTVSSKPLALSSSYGPLFSGCSLLTGQSKALASTQAPQVSLVSLSFRSNGSIGAVRGGRRLVALLPDGDAGLDAANIRNSH